MNKVTFGLSNVHYALATEGPDGSWTFGTSKRLPGAQEFASEIIGGETPVFGDDRILVVLYSRSGVKITLKLTEIDDEFKKDVLGYQADTHGNLIEVINSETKTFALGFEIQGDVKARRVWFYLCTASPAGESSKSKTESVEANALSLTITARPIQVGTSEITHAPSYAGSDNYATYLTSSPTLPVFTAGV
jgi:phi13 family phage major tail protein